MKETALVDKEYVLQKMGGKGGWTYLEIPEILQSKDRPFGWVRVKGFIESYEIKNYNLMPMGNGKLFLPVRAEIRKTIKKQQGDTVRIRLYADNLPTEIPEELKECFNNEPMILERFLNYSDKDQKNLIEWIYSAKTDEIKIERINKTIDLINSGQPFYK